MTWKQFRFCLYCTLLWPVVILVSGRLHVYLGAAAWWVGSKSGAIGDSLWQFQTDTASAQCMVFGFVLGCVPISRLRDLFIASLAHWRHKPSTTTPVELDRTRPLLWAWVLPFAVFCIRFLTVLYEGTGRSVLESARLPVIDTFGYFFTNSANFVTSTNGMTRLIDHYFVIQPMLFAAMYSIAVWLRYHRPGHEPMEPEPAPTDTLGS